MGKYDALRTHLESQSNAGVQSVTLRFAQIEEMVGSLPPSARTTRQWWANDSKTQALAWHRAGWHVDQVNPDAGWVRFAPGVRGGTRAAQRGPLAITPQNQAAPGVHAHTASWHWEGNVQAAVVTYFTGAGWSLVSQVDTASQERGVDVVLEREGERLLVEVKGYPGTTCARGDRAGLAKPTRPSVQAKHWLAEAVFACMRLRSRESGAAVALAPPTFPRYRDLVSEVSGSLMAAGIGWIWVLESGAVDASALRIGRD